MNRRERAVVLLVTAALVVGVAVSYCRRARLSREAALNPVAVAQDAAPGGSPDSVGSLLPLDISRATSRQLDRLPGIGPVIASRIIAYRQRRGGFRSVSELRAVPGIGEKRYSVLKELVTIGPASAAAVSGR